MKKFGAYISALVCALALFTAACQERPKTAADFGTVFPMKISQKSFGARVACHEPEKAKGLMFVKSLPEDETMLFVNSVPSRAAYWMKNTSIALDIGFFDSNGILTEVKSLYPHNLDTVYSSRGDILYCLEANAGWFSKNGIKSGDKLDMELLKSAIDARLGRE